MKRTLWLLSFCLLGHAVTLAGEAVPPPTHPDSKGWPDLLAADLSNVVAPRGIWSFTDGVLTATED
jgi:hypothetical protein